MRKVDTFAPHNDGHQWRKYGEKKINNTNFPRSVRSGADFTCLFLEKKTQILLVLFLFFLVCFLLYRGGKGFCICMCSEKSILASKEYAFYRIANLL